MVKRPPRILTGVYASLVLAVLLANGKIGNAQEGSPSKRTGRLPNVVLILSDDQAWTDFGFMGHAAVRTPHLDFLASQSAVFPRGYVPTSLCRPSLATVISGLYAHQHRITGNDPPRGADRNEMLRHIRRIPTLPRLLAQRGYVSFQSGKWWEGSYLEGGFSAGMTHGDPARGGRHGDEGLKIGREGLQPIVDFLNSAGDKPFFLWYAPMMPHTPHNPPARLLEHYRQTARPENIAQYYAMCEWFDETCGQLLDELDRRKLSQNTLVVFVTDNGWIAPADMRGQAKPAVPYGPKSKRSPYEGGVRTPILLRWPGRVAPARYDTLVSSIDLAPTILAAAGLRAPHEMPGANLLEVASANGKLECRAIFGEIYEHDVVDLNNPAPGLRYRWAIENHWKVILPVGLASTSGSGTSAPELYDLSSDPLETHNLASQRRDLVEQLTRRADDWWPGAR